jgi:hypothetical protein
MKMADESDSLQEVHSLLRSEVEMVKVEEA